jgi:UDP-N-acetylbacillosamine N-acetyltransferase
MKKIVLWGAGGHALVVADIVRLSGEFQICGFVDDVNPDRHNMMFDGAPILGGSEQLDGLLEKGIEHLILAVGDCEARLRLAEVALAKGYQLATAIHPQTIMAYSASIGSGSVVTAGAVIGPEVEIGANCIINTCASIDHECVIADGVHVGPGVHLGGKVRVGRGAWIGIGGIVKDSINIGPYAVVGAGSVVLSDIPPGVVAYGTPAKVIREVQTNVHQTAI